MYDLKGYKIVGYDPITHEGFSLFNSDVKYDININSIWKKSNGFHLQTSKEQSLLEVPKHQNYLEHGYALLEFDLYAEYFLFDSKLHGGPVMPDAYEGKTICASKAKLVNVTLFRKLPKAI